MTDDDFKRIWTNQGYSVFESVLRPNSTELGKARIPVLGVFRKNEDNTRDSGYRFLLRATIHPDNRSTLGVLAMNPSKALRTDHKSDHTVSRLINYLRLKPGLGYGRILLGNCFARYETDSTRVTADTSEITMMNNCCLEHLFKDCKTVVIAAGGVPIVKERLKCILETSGEKCSLKCFRQNGWVGAHPSRGSYADWQLVTYNPKPLFN